MEAGASVSRHRKVPSCLHHQGCLAAGVHGRPPAPGSRIPRASKPFGGSAVRFTARNSSRPLSLALRSPPLRARRGRARAACPPHREGGRLVGAPGMSGTARRTGSRFTAYPRNCGDVARLGSARWPALVTRAMYAQRPANGGPGRTTGHLWRSGQKNFATAIA